MDSFEVTKIVGGLLATVFVIFTIAIVSDAIFDSPAPEKEGFAIAAAEGGSDTGAAAKEEKKPEQIAPLLASADPANGEKIFKKCAACHDISKGGPNKVGPNLWGVVDRPVASHEGFSYSAGMKTYSEDSSKVWDYQDLSEFLTKPKDKVNGTAMGFAGLKKIQDRADLIAYLRTQADQPVPLPEAGGGDAAANGSAGDAATTE